MYRQGKCHLCKAEGFFFQNKSSTEIQSHVERRRFIQSFAVPADACADTLLIFCVYGLVPLSMQIPSVKPISWRGSSVSFMTRVEVNITSTMTCQSLPPADHCAAAYEASDRSSDLL